VLAGTEPPVANAPGSPGTSCYPLGLCFEPCRSTVADVNASSDVAKIRRFVSTNINSLTTKELWTNRWRAKYRNTLYFLSSTYSIHPIIISSHVWSPQVIRCFGSGFCGFFAELSKWARQRRVVPLASRIGFSGR
jgi:hypothetical protein